MAFTERSEPTRNAILVAARKLLTERGYEATTIRAVAAEVGVDPSMVMRYYGNKAGLFSTAINVDLHLDQVPGTPKSQLGKALARHFLNRWEGDLADDAIVLILRSAPTNAMAAEHGRAMFVGQVIPFIERATGGGPDTAHRAALVVAQVLGLALSRYLLEFPPTVEMDQETLVNSVGPVLQHYLTGDLDSPVTESGNTPPGP